MIKGILLVAVIIFYAIRLRASVLKRASKHKINIPLFVGEILILALVVIQLTNLDPFKFKVPQVVNYLGLAFALAAAVFASIARVSLKKNYVPAMTAAPPESLTTGGVYKTVRHPSYLGTLLAFVGFELALSSYFIFLSLILLAILVKQIEKEEKMLSEVHPNKWQAFIKQTPYKLVPFIY